MARKYRRRHKNNTLNIFFAIILIFLIGILLYKIYTEQINPKVTNKDNTNIKTKQSDDKESDISNKVEDGESNQNEESKKANEVTTKSSKNETIENKNESARRGGTIILELMGEEEITISKGSKYEDVGVKATYSDGSDASNEVEVDNAVDTSKKGTYTVTFYAGNAVVIRRVTVQ